MKLSRFLIPTLRQPPKDADNVSAQLMIRAGLIRKIAAGLYDWLPLGLRVLKKVEQIVREEMDRAGGLEVWLPHIQPREFWEETGRWQVYGKELLRIKDRKGTEFCFAPTAEEVITDLVRRDVQSYRQLPLLLYQFGTKFRDEIRPRFGVMRAREFYMKDAYSFHAGEKDAEETYQKVYDAYSRIFKRCGLKFGPVEADTGAIGGNFSHEFMVLADTGEEEIVSCPACGYAANVERAECPDPGGAAPSPGAFLPVEVVDTPGAWTVEDISRLLDRPKENLLKTLFYKVDGAPVVALLRGDHELNEPKLMRALGGKMIEKMPEEDYSRLAGCPVGFAGPQGLKERACQQDPRFRLLADTQAARVLNGVSGANLGGKHARNLNIGRDFEPDQIADLRKVREGDVCPRCAANGLASVLRFSRGIEVGHTFKLGTKYSQAMNAVYLDDAGKSQPMIMGCYGIGVSRIVAAAIEQNHDDNGIIWTRELSPFKVLIVPVDYSHAPTREVCDKICGELEAAGLDVLLDDRSDRAGIKFKDADLVGIALRVTVGEKGLAKNQVEIKPRAGGETRFVEVGDAVREALKFFEN